MRAVRRDDADFEQPATSPAPAGPSQSSSPSAPAKPSNSLTPHVVRVDADAVRSGWDYERLRVRCWRCPPTAPERPVSELTLGLCPLHLKQKEEREDAEERVYRATLRAYAIATGDTRASDFADFLDEDDANPKPGSPLLDERCERFNRERVSDEVTYWKERQ